MSLLLLVAKVSKERSDRDRNSESLGQRKRNLELYIEKTEEDRSLEGLGSNQEEETR